LKVVLEAAWKEWERKWHTNDEVAENDDGVSLDGGENDEKNHTLDTAGRETLESKEEEITLLNSKLKMADMRCEKLADESKTLQDLVDSEMEKHESFRKECILNNETHKKEVGATFEIFTSKWLVVLLKQIKEADIELSTTRKVAGESAETAQCQIARLHN
jgi:hypothetical protein